MVALTRITTRAGDGGLTFLGDATRVPKTAVRLDTYGTVDEANTLLGAARLYTRGRGGIAGEADAMLARIQNELLDLAADLCLPERETPRRRPPLRMLPSQVERLEAEIAALDAASLDAAPGPAPAAGAPFPSGRSPAAALLRLAHAVIRRAERRLAALAREEPVGETARQYTNRLSDHLLRLARRLDGAEAGAAA
ncbi:ATP:cob(I)alamin adenosyltransferase [Rhodospirillum centenum]|uniref:Corrinoid adenosyltransferase n=1 Tax=Rhodospirillum centenum (strain ATCC 51521 / SW) TaxID=414684 RepID=B6IYS6_RHOCS|nr:ATP:cob(I)alamin adenosyltransferase [Rhodospirillum centenum]ACJ01450.1 ATP:cob(I)alamin adenosyltransferase, putative [Rhodospirillum centenum SW]